MLYIGRSFIIYLAIEPRFLYKYILSDCEISLSVLFCPSFDPDPRSPPIQRPL